MIPTLAGLSSFKVTGNLSYGPGKTKKWWGRGEFQFEQPGDPAARKAAAELWVAGALAPFAGFARQVCRVTPDSDGRFVALLLEDHSL